MGERTEYHQTYMQIKRRRDTYQRERDDRMNEIAKEKMRDIKQRAINYKGGKCEICGGEFHAACFDFHHKNPNEKDKSIAAMITPNVDWELLKDELDKCVLLCSNCHRVLHYGQPKPRRKKNVQQSDPHLWTIDELYERTGKKQGRPDQDGNARHD